MKKIILKIINSQLLGMTPLNKKKNTNMIWEPSISHSSIIYHTEAEPDKGGNKRSAMI